VDIRQGDLFGPIKQGEPFHIIVSNPPYVKEEEWEQLQPEIRLYEPKEALVAGQGGLEVLKRIIKEGRGYLLPNGMMLLEIAPSQARDVMGLMEEEGYKDIRLIRDLAGAERAIWGRAPL
jgi:release factor glutamine methyltransferase